MCDCWTDHDTGKHLADPLPEPRLVPFEGEVEALPSDEGSGRGFDDA
jgi:hypothetical protein